MEIITNNNNINKQDTREPDKNQPSYAHLKQYPLQEKEKGRTDGRQELQDSKSKSRVEQGEITKTEIATDEH